jgi:hypothetical protein
VQGVDAGVLLVATGGREPALRAWLERHGTLMAAAEADPAAVRLEGRGRVARAPAPEGGDGSWVVRHYHRGGAAAGLLGDRYLRVGVPRPLRELELLEAVRRLGVPAPAPIGAAVYRAGAFYRGDLVTRWVPDSTDLATVLFGAGASPPAPAMANPHAAVAATGRLVRLLHERGVEHRDLNLKNILIIPGPGRPTSPDPRALVLDLDRARLHAGGVPAGTRKAMIDRFWRSARKWERRTGRSLPASLEAAFEGRYAEGPEPASAG